jgi:TfoX/Sxy family transcriptional regulator of competence genes
VKNKEESSRAGKPTRPRRPPPLHRATLEDSIARLGIRGVSVKRMFGGLCYYAQEKPFSILLGNALALKLPAAQLRTGCEGGDGQLFHPGGGDFIMREYLELSEQVLMDEGRVDAYVQASHRFVAGLGGQEEGLAWNDLLEGREALYSKTSWGEREERRRHSKT